MSEAFDEQPDLPDGSTHRSRAFGTWEDEASAAAEFDYRIQQSGLFERVFVEVRGYYLAHRPNRQNQNARIDRFLIPGRKLRDLGWTRDIGVELKRSGEKIGRPLAQAIDYTYCAFNVGTHWMIAENIFLWPFPKQYRDTESVMCQSGIGVIYDSTSSLLIFQLEKQVIRVERDGTVKVQTPVSGTKTGSR